MKNLLLSTLILSFAVTISAHNSELKTFPFKRTAKIQGTPDRIAAIPLDKKIYKNTNQHYSNLRIIDESGNNIPFSVKNIVPLKTKILYTAHPANMENLQLFPEKNMVCANFLINPPSVNCVNVVRCCLIYEIVEPVCK